MTELPTPPSRAWVATRKGLIELLRTPTGWQLQRTHFLGEPVSAMLPPDPRGRMLAALNLGHFGVKLHASDDAGQHWREVACPAYPPQPEGAPGPSWTLRLIWSLARAGGLYLAGTLPGGLFRSEDEGQSWQLVHSLWQRPERLEWMGGGYDTPGIHSICPHPHRAASGWVLGVSCGGKWDSPGARGDWGPRAEGLRADYMPPERSHDPNIQDPHALARCSAVPEVLWCQHHNGIWRTEDNGGHWQEIQSAPVSAFGFAVAAHPTDPLTAWFVPAVADQTRVPAQGALVVQCTRDGGRSFEVQRQGLPASDCFDLVYRHGLAVAPDGRHLLMGSTTGHLWSTSDAGASWHLVQAHLPPVHAVAFG